MHSAIKNRLVLAKIKSKRIQPLFLRVNLVERKYVNTVADLQSWHGNLLAQVLAFLTFLDIHIVIEVDHLHLAIFLEHTNTQDGIGLIVICPYPLFDFVRKENSE